MSPTQPITPSQRFRLVIFDMDGVLVDTSPHHARIFENLWQEIGIEGPPYESIAGWPTRDIIAKVTAALSPSPARIDAWTLRKQTLARAAIKTEPIAFDDTLPAVHALVRAGIPLALGTGASRPTAELVLERLGLTEVFSPVITATDVARGKPAPDVYLRSLTVHGVPAEEALVIEDSPSGLAAAAASGAWAASVRTGHTLDTPRWFGAYPDLRTLVQDLGLMLEPVQEEAMVSGGGHERA